MNLVASCYRRELRAQKEGKKMRWVAQWWAVGSDGGHCGCHDNPSRLFSSLLFSNRSTLFVPKERERENAGGWWTRVRVGGIGGLRGVVKATMSHIRTNYESLSRKRERERERPEHNRVCSTAVESITHTYSREREEMMKLKPKNSRIPTPSTTTTTMTRNRRKRHPIRFQALLILYTVPNKKQNTEKEN